MYVTVSSRFWRSVRILSIGLVSEAAASRVFCVRKIQMGQACCTAVMVCLVSKLSTRGAGRAMSAEGMPKPISVETGASASRIGCWSTSL